AGAGEFIEPNNYPKGVRDSLRDLVSYGRAERLINTSYWRPEQSNQIYTLDQKALIAGNPAASAKLSLSDPSVHPLLRVGAIYDDLEAWHLARGDREAALEARIERLLSLWRALSDDADKKAVIVDLEAHLPASSGVGRIT